MLIWMIVLAVVALMTFIRLAPSDVSRWHRSASIAGTETKTLDGGYIWREVLADDGKAQLQALAEAATQTPRTMVLAGSVEEGQITYITRSNAMGFPDYTTMGIYETSEGQPYLEVYARLRFGKSDLGVNAKRVKGWLAALK